MLYYILVVQASMCPWHYGLIAVLQKTNGDDEDEPYKKKKNNNVRSVFHCVLFENPFSQSLYLKLLAQ